MGLVDYETDTEDREGSNGVCSFNQSKGTTIPPLRRARPGEIQQGNVDASLTVSHSLDEPDGIPDPLFLGNELTWKRTPGETNPSETTIGFGGIKRKIISMEQAMKNEVRHKKTNDCLQKQTCSNLLEPPRIVPGESSRQRIVGVKRDAPPTNLPCLPPPHVRRAPESQNVVTFCKECNIICSGVVNLRQHYEGKKHKAKVEELKIKQNGANMGTGPLQCKVCKVLCMGEYNLREHLAGKKHAACLQAIQIKDDMEDWMISTQ